MFCLINYPGLFSHNMKWFLVCRCAGDCKVHFLSLNPTLRALQLLTTIPTSGSLKIQLDRAFSFRLYCYLGGMDQMILEVLSSFWHSVILSPKVILTLVVCLCIVSTWIGYSWVVWTVNPSSKVGVFQLSLNWHLFQTDSFQNCLFSLLSPKL